MNSPDQESRVARVFLDDEKELSLPIVEGVLGSHAIDVSNLYNKTGMFTYDPGFKSTASCRSAITYIDGEKGILRYRGYDVHDLAQNKCSFLEVAHLLLYGELPNQKQFQGFSREVSEHTMVHEQLTKVLNGFSRQSHPMAILVGCVASLSAFYHDILDIQNYEERMCIASRVIAKIPTMVAMVHKYTVGKPIMYPNNQLPYVENFLHMMFSVPTGEYTVNPLFAQAMDTIMVLHADHEQNASTSTVRLCGSSGANPFACIAAGMVSLWGPAHGGANEAVLQMLRSIGNKEKVYQYIRRAKDPNDSFRLMGFGHRVYKNFDPRADILRDICHHIIEESDGNNRKLLEIATELERIALEDEYFVKRKLYPNVDFYSGIIMDCMGIPTQMFTVIFALARCAGWIAQWAEMLEDTSLRIGRPRQLYVGVSDRPYVSIEKRPL